MKNQVKKSLWSMDSKHEILTWKFENWDLISFEQYSMSRALWYINWKIDENERMFNLSVDQSSQKSLWWVYLERSVLTWKLKSWDNVKFEQSTLSRALWYINWKIDENQKVLKFTHDQSSQKSLWSMYLERSILTWKFKSWDNVKFEQSTLSRALWYINWKIDENQKVLKFTHDQSSQKSLWSMYLERSILTWKFKSWDSMYFE